SAFSVPAARMARLRRRSKERPSAPRRGGRGDRQGSITNASCRRLRGGKTRRPRQESARLEAGGRVNPVGAGEQRRLGDPRKSACVRVTSRSEESPRGQRRSLATRERERRERIRCSVEPLWASRAPVAFARSRASSRDVLPQPAFERSRN